MINCGQSAGKTKKLEPSETTCGIKYIHFSNIKDDNALKYLKYFREELEWSILKISRYLNKYNIRCSEPSIRRRLKKLNITYKPKQKGSFYNRKHTEKTKEKLSMLQKGKPGFWLGKTISYETRQKISNSSKGKKLKEATVKKKSEWMIKNNPFRGKTHSEQTKEWLSIFHTGKEISKETKEKLSLIFKGKNNPNYKHGDYCGYIKSDHRYSNKSYIRIKNEVLNIFNHKCTQCDEVEGLQLHHIIPVKKIKELNIDFNNKFNLIPLCVNCHQKTFYKESEFEDYFKDIVRTTWRHVEDSRNDYPSLNEK